MFTVSVFAYNTKKTFWKAKFQNIELRFLGVLLAPNNSELLRAYDDVMMNCKFVIPIFHWDKMVDLIDFDNAPGQI